MSRNRESSTYWIPFMSGGGNITAVFFSELNPVRVSASRICSANA
jgi:hypothetical protein